MVKIIIFSCIMVEVLETLIAAPLLQCITEFTVIYNLKLLAVFILHTNVFFSSKGYNIVCLSKIKSRLLYTTV